MAQWCRKGTRSVDIVILKCLVANQLKGLNFDAMNVDIRSYAESKLEENLVALVEGVVFNLVWGGDVTTLICNIASVGQSWNLQGFTFMMCQKAMIFNG